MAENPKRVTQGQYVVEILQSGNATATFWYYVLHVSVFPKSSI